MSLRQEIDIERLVTWALRDQGLGWDAPGSGTSLSSLAALGTMVSGGMIADPSVGLLSNDDAIVVRQQIDRLPSKARALVIMHGRTGTRPEGADEPMPEPQQLTNKRGQPMWDYANPNDRRSEKRPAMDLYGWSKAKALVEASRAGWAVWREGLIALIAPLNALMEHHVATGPEAPAEPWTMAPKVVLGAVPIDAPDLPQPWLTPLSAIDDELDRGLTVDEMRALAQTEVRAVAPMPVGPLQPVEPGRRRKRARRARPAVENSVLESVAANGTHGGS